MSLMKINSNCEEMRIKLTASDLIRVICAVHVVVTFLMASDALSVRTGELI